MPTLRIKHNLLLGFLLSASLFSTICSAKQDSLNQHIYSQLIGVSALGYTPVWHLNITESGLDVSFPNIKVKHLTVQSITKNNNTWTLQASNGDIKATIIVEKKKGVCEMSGQIYPMCIYATIQKNNHVEATYSGIAIGHNQKPLPPQELN